MITLRKEHYFGLIALLIPILLIGTLEILLRHTALYKNSSLLLKYPDDNVQIFNPAYPQKYFSVFKPSSAVNPFTINKRDNTYRIFVLGGSTTAGYPYSFAYGFPAILEINLKKRYPEITFEVINLGLTATNSFTVRDINRKLRKYDPDLVVLYSGHNEFYGAMGGASTESVFSSTFLSLANMWLADFAIYQHVNKLVQYVFASGSSSEIRTTTMQYLIRDSNVEHGGTVYNRTRHRFSLNYDSILRSNQKHGIPTIALTIVSNLKDQPPFDRQSDSERHYEMANSLFLNGDITDARQNYEIAKDLDRIRFRASSDFNAVIRDLSAKYGTELIDIDKSYAIQCLSGIEDDSCFTDHLHPNYFGYAYIANKIMDRIHPGVAGILRSNRQMNTSSASARVTPVPDAFERMLSGTHIELLKANYPFVEQIQEPGELFQDKIAHLMSTNDPISQSVSDILLNGNNPAFNYRSLIQSSTFSNMTPDEQLRFYYSWFNWEPLNFEILKRATQTGLEYDASFEVMEPLLLIAANRTNSTPYFNVLGALYLKELQYDDANHFLSVVEQRNPNDPDMLYNFARLYLEIGNEEVAFDYFTRFESIR